MKQRIRKNSIAAFLSTVLAAVLFLSAVRLLRTSPAKAEIGASVSVSPTVSVTDIGSTVTLNYTISPSCPVNGFSFSVSVSDGLSFSGLTASASGVVIEGAKVKREELSPHVGNISGTITVRVTKDGPQTVSITDGKLTAYGQQFAAGYDKGFFQGSGSFNVRTQQQTDESRAEMQRLASIAAEEASKRASREAEYNESVRASASIRESELESRYLEESESESIRESILESQSVEELTRPTEIGDYAYILYEFGGFLLEDPDDPQSEKMYEKRFYFADSDCETPLPEEYVKRTLKIREMDVLALQKDGMDKDTYLVYGMESERHEPMWFYYHAPDDTFFPFDYLNADTEFKEQETTETETEPAEQGLSEEDRKKGEKNLGFLLGFSALSGALLAAVIAALAGGKKKTSGKASAPYETVKPVSAPEIIPHAVSTSSVEMPKEPEKPVKTAPENLFDEIELSETATVSSVSEADENEILNSFSETFKESKNS